MQISGAVFPPRSIANFLSSVRTQSMIWTSNVLSEQFRRDFGDVPALEAGAGQFVLARLT